MQTDRKLHFLAALPTLLWAAPALAQQPVSLADAIRTTLARHPALEIQEQQVGIQRALRLQASGAFDRVLTSGLSQSYQNTPLTVQQQLDLTVGPARSQAANVTGFYGGASRLSRNGISVQMRNDLDRIADNLTNQTGVNRSTTQIQMTIPLLAGRGREVVAAQETAAGHEIDASLFDLSHTAAVAVANTARSYLNLIAAQKTLRVAIDSERRGQQMLDSIQDLIKADKSPRSDLHNVMANLAERTANRIASEQQVIKARELLAIDMGLRVDSPLQLPDAIEDLPGADVDAVQLLDPGMARRYIAMALRNRGDVRAAGKRQETALALVAPALDLLRPHLDLNLTTCYSGLAEGLRADRYLSAFLLGGKGPTVTGGLQFTLPSRSYARGQVAQAQAAARQAELRVNDAGRIVAAEVVVALEAVRNSALQLRSAAESVQSFERALEGERERLSMGLGSVVELLTIEDRLTNATIRLVQRQAACPQAVLDLRLATGTLVQPARRVLWIDPADLFQLPPDQEQP